MDLLHIHLILNHVPVLGSIGALALLGWGLIRRSSEVVGVALVAIAVVALLTIPVYLTGETAEERIQGFPGVAEAAIDTHQDSGTAAFASIEIAGAAAIVALVSWRLRRRFLLLPVAATLLAGVIAMGLVIRAASLGGKIRHTELGGNAAASQVEDHDD